MEAYSCVIWYIELNYAFVFVGNDLYNRQIWVLLQWSNFALTILIPVDLFDYDSNSCHLGYDSDFNTIFINDSVSDFELNHSHVALLCLCVFAFKAFLPWSSG